MATERPALRPLGPTWREVRLEVGLRQSDVAELLGWGANGQAMVSYREKAPEQEGAIAPRVEELVRFEDAVGLQRGTVLRRAGYVVDAGDPLEQVEGWTFLAPAAREAVRRVIEPEWIRHLRNAPRERPVRRRAPGARPDR